MSDHKVHIGDTLEVLKTLPPDFFDTVITSPPYWGLRRYFRPDTPESPLEIGQEPTPEQYVERLVAVFEGVRRVLRPDGTFWLNIGDSYYGSWGNYAPTGSGGQRAKQTERFKRDAYDDKSDWRPPTSRKHPVLKNKDLVGVPWRLALAMQAAGWWLRQDIIWAKPNPMPESTRDRCTRSHEHIFMLAKSERYHYDHKAIEEDGAYPAGTKGGKASATRAAEPGVNSRPPEYKTYSGKRNKRDVWRVPTACFKGAHFATFPVKLIEPCVLAGSRPGGQVLDPFCGTGTVGEACERHGRIFTGIDLDPRAPEWFAARLAKAGAK